MLKEIAIQTYLFFRAGRLLRNRKFCKAFRWKPSPCKRYGKANCLFARAVKPPPISQPSHCPNPIVVSKSLFPSVLRKARHLQERFPSALPQMLRLRKLPISVGSWRRCVALLTYVMRLTYDNRSAKRLPHFSGGLHPERCSTSTRRHHVQRLEYRTLYTGFLNFISFCIYSHCYGASFNTFFFVFVLPEAECFNFSGDAPHVGVLDYAVVLQFLLVAKAHARHHEAVPSRKSSQRAARICRMVVRRFGFFVGRLSLSR